MTVEFWWLGQAGFRLRDLSGSGPVVFVDPFLVANPNRSWEAPLTAEQLAEQADVVLCTHGHGDHFDRQSLKTAAAVLGARFTVIVPTPLAPEAIELGIPEDRVVGAQPGSPWSVPGLRVNPVPARHGVNVSDAYNFGEQLSDGQVRYLGYVMKFGGESDERGGVRVYHAGDCIPYEHHAEIVGSHKPHVALLPINGRDTYREGERNIVGNMDHREAARLASDLGVDLLMPMHWEMFPHNRGFPHHLVEYVTANFPTLTVVVPGRGARVRYTPA